MIETDDQVILLIFASGIISISIRTFVLGSSRMLKDGDRLVVYSGGGVLADNVVYCSSPQSLLKGLAGRRSLSINDGILIEFPESRKGNKGLTTSIHMFRMNFPITAAWLDQNGEVKTSVLAQPGHPYYASTHPAWYVLEVHEDHLPTLFPSAKVAWKQWSESDV